MAAVASGRSASIKRDPILRNGSGTRVLGTMLLAEVSAGGLDYRLEAQALPSEQRDLIMIHLILQGDMTLIQDGVASRCLAGDLVVLDLSREWCVLSGARLRCYTVLVPRRAMPTLLGDALGSAVLRVGPGLLAVRRLLASLLALEPTALSREQAGLAGRAVIHLLRAVLVPLALGTKSVAPLREATLLERATAAIDAAPGRELDVPGLCASLGCSRSALYRATASVSGIAELIVRRRLAAVHRILRDPADQRSIAAIAEATGFSDPGQFSRQFKRVFGTTPGRARAGVRAEPEEGEFNPMLSLINSFQPGPGEASRSCDR